jgi:hypothetical protein
MSQQRLHRLDWSIRIAGLLISMGLVLIAYLSVYRALDRESSRIHHQIRAARLFLGTTEEVDGRHVESSSRLGVLEAHLTELETRIPEAAGESDFLAQLAQLASRSKVQIHDYRPGAVVDRGSYNDMEISFSANGRYESICRFLAGLESLERLCKVTGLDVASVDDPDQPYPFEVTLSIYFYPPTHGAGSRHG